MKKPFPKARPTRASLLAQKKKEEQVQPAPVKKKKSKSKIAKGIPKIVVTPAKEEAKEEEGEPLPVEWTSAASLPYLTPPPKVAAMPPALAKRLSKKYVKPKTEKPPPRPKKKQKKGGHAELESDEELIALGEGKCFGCGDTLIYGLVW